MPLAGWFKSPQFSDVPADHWAAGTIKRAAFYGLATGYPNGTFKPDAQVSRAEATVMATRVMDRALLMTGIVAAALLLTRK